MGDIFHQVLYKSCPLEDFPSVFFKELVMLGVTVAVHFLAEFSRRSSKYRIIW